MEPILLQGSVIALFETQWNLYNCGEHMCFVHFFSSLFFYMTANFPLVATSFLADKLLGCFVEFYR